jgi:tRNA-splicing ligase RtcB
MAGTRVFGVGKSANLRADSSVFDDSRWAVLSDVAGKATKDSLLAGARNQLSTIGGGNHYCCVLVESDETGEHTTPTSPVWITTHFGSRGLGHNIASGFLRLAAGYGFSEKPPRGQGGESETATLFEASSDLGQAYMDLLGLAGRYAYAGRNIVVQQVLDILGAIDLDTVHNHHNYTFTEEHGGKELFVVRKGATPLSVGERGAVGGSMCDISVIVQGATDENDMSFSSSVHGSGRVMSRTEAKGKRNRKTGEYVLDAKGNPKKVGKVSRKMMADAVRDYGVELRGGDLDESPFVYRKLSSVLENHPNTVVKHTLRPAIVCMAPHRVIDPWKD